MNGTIKTKVLARKFGFIAREGQEAGAKDLFFHAEDLVDVTFEELNEGDKVTFDEVMGEKGPAAKNVKRE
jgi:CspA family cold shock protein